MALTDLDTRVALGVQTPQVDFNQLLGNSLNTYNTIRGMGQQGLLSRLLAQNTDANGQVNLANALQSAQSNPNLAYQPDMVNTLSGLIQQQDAARQKAQQDAIKFNTDNAKTQSETRKTESETNLSQLNASAPIFDLLSKGSPNEALNYAATMTSRGLFSKDDYAGLAQQIRENLDNPQALQDYGKAMYRSMLDPKYNIADANTVANNETSIKTTGMNNATTMRGQDITSETAKRGQDLSAQTANNRLAFDKIVQEQKIAQANGEFETMTGTDGKAYAVYQDGRVEPLLLGSGEAFMPQGKKGNGQPKLSDTALKSVNEMNVQLATANQNNNKISGLINDIQSGKLNLSAANQLGAKTRNLMGMSDENSRGVENFQTALNQAVNDLLMMAKGVQTEGDAQRAANVIAANPPRDNASALQALQRIAAVQQNTMGVLNQNINGIYENYGISRPNNKASVSSVGKDQSKLNSILFGQ